MIFDRKTLVAALALTIVALSEWPIWNEPPLQRTIFLCGGVLVVVLGVSEWARSNRVVVGTLGLLFVAQGGYEYVSHTSLVGIAFALLYWTIGSTVALYQSGFAPWGHPNDET